MGLRAMWFNDPGQCTGGFFTWDCLCQWQTLITRVAALGAAVVAVLGTIGDERRRANRQLAAHRNSISGSLSAETIHGSQTQYEAEMTPCFVVTAVIDGRRVVELQKLGIQLCDGSRAFLVEAETASGIRLPLRLEAGPSSSAQFQSPISTERW